MGCRRPLSAWGQAVVGAGLESGLCQARIARVLGRSPSVIRGGIKRNAGADGCYRGGEAGHMAARRRVRPKKRGQRRARSVSTSRGPGWELSTGRGSTRAPSTGGGRALSSGGRAAVPWPHENTRARMAGPQALACPHARRLHEHRRGGPRRRRRPRPQGAPGPIGRLRLRRHRHDHRRLPVRPVETGPQRRAGPGQPSAVVRRRPVRRL